MLLAFSVNRCLDLAASLWLNKFHCPTYRLHLSYADAFFVQAATAELRLNRVRRFSRLISVYAASPVDFRLTPFIVGTKMHGIRMRVSRCGDDCKYLRLFWDAWSGATDACVVEKTISNTSRKSVVDKPMTRRVVAPAWHIDLPAQSSSHTPTNLSCRNLRYFDLLWICSETSCTTRARFTKYLTIFYDYLTIILKLRSTYDRRLLHKTSYEGRKAFLWYNSLAKSSEILLVNLLTISLRDILTRLSHYRKSSYDKLKITLW